MDLFKRIQDLSALYDDNGPSATVLESRPMFANGQLVQPNDDGSRPGYMGKYIKGTKNPRVFTGTKGLFTTPLADGTKMYEAHIISKNTELGPAMKRRFPFTKQGKEDALKAMKEHKEKYPNIAKKTVYRDQTTIQKGKDGILKYQRKNQPTKYYDPKKYGSEEKAFKAAKKDVAEAQVAQKTANQVDVDINEIKKLRDEGFSQAKIAKKLGVNQRTVSDRLVKAGEYTRDLSTRDPIAKEVQKDIKTKYSQVKNWDFKKYIYGVSPTADTRMYDRIRRFVDEPKKFSMAVDFSTPQGWMAAQMERSYKLGNKNYTPIKTIINNKNKIVGFIDNTEFGGGGKYIVNEKFIKGKNADGIPMSLHPDYEDTAKFVDISKKAKLPVQGVLKELLKNEGVDTTRISLSDLFKQIKNKVGYDGVKNALEKHHISGVKNRATGNYQLLNRDLNALAREVTKEIEQGDLSRVGELKKRGAMVEVGGQTYGGGPKTPGGQLKRFEKQVTNFFQNDPNSKNVIVRMAKIGCPGKANGGRIGFDQGLNVTSCAAKGVEKLKGNPAELTPGDQANVRALAKSGKAVKFLKGVLGPGAILGEVIFEGGAAANKFMDQGMPIKQALGESYINKYLLGPKTQIDVEAERAKEMSRGEDFAMAERGRRMAPFMPQSATADKNRLRDRMNAEGILTIQDAKNELKNIGDYYGQGYTPYGLNKLYEDAGMQNPGFGIEKVGPRTGKYNEEKGLQDYLNSMKMQKIADAGGVANMAGGGIAKEAGDRSGPAPVSGPQPQGLSYLMNRVKNY